MQGYPNITLLHPTNNEFNVIGDAYRAAEGFQTSGGLYTIGITAINLTGRVYIEGSLSDRPGPDDWFAIPQPNSQTPYIEFKYDPKDPETKVIGYSFRGNVIWIRARLDRDYLPPLGNVPPNLGRVEQVVLNTGNYLLGQTLEDTDYPVGGSGILSVSGRNLGDGHHIFQGKTGSDNVILNFRTIKEGPGIKITEDSDHLILEATGGGAGGASKFTELSDAPSQISDGILIGLAGELIFTAPPDEHPKVLVMRDGDVIWEDPNGGVQVNGTDAQEITFQSPLVVTHQNGEAVVGLDNTASSVSNREWVEIQYSPGSTGNLTGTNTILYSSSGVSARIIDQVHCLMEFTFTGRPYIPSQITLYGQNYSTNVFTITPAATNAVRTVYAGSDPMTPNLMGDFTGPITLQVRMSDTNSNAPMGKRARAYIVFGF